MAEMRTIPCPSCETANQPLAAVDGIEEYRCRSCGIVYYGPCGCDTSHRTAEEARKAAAEAALPGDWQTSLPPVDPHDMASTARRPGCG